ncbi:MAG: hypothetical protein A2Y10_13190 [Planctomycetes bacterium GWF2_41_51]|nr:MAG: hypothetical protein A2Y10_13190 [Planctomycetes bacterium GWF2_41_51]HBG60689.1 hypothetical protein [Candidatus Omnitrophota bacterium]
MPDAIATILLVAVFIILMVVIFNAVKSTFNFSRFGNLIMAVCVSTLAVIGMNRFLKGSEIVILLPYAALGITILSILLLLFIGRQKNKIMLLFPWQRTKKISEFEKEISEIHNRHRRNDH